MVVKPVLSLGKAQEKTDRRFAEAELKKALRPFMPVLYNNDKVSEGKQPEYPGIKHLQELANFIAHDYAGTLDKTCCLIDRNDYREVEVAAVRWRGRKLWILRGSDSEIDWFHNLRFLGKSLRLKEDMHQRHIYSGIMKAPMTNTGIRLHRGFATGVERALEAASRARLVAPDFITGHSAGAARGAILANLFEVPFIGFAVPRYKYNRSAQSLYPHQPQLAINRKDDWVRFAPPWGGRFGSLHLLEVPRIWFESHRIHHYQEGLDWIVGDGGTKR